MQEHIEHRQVILIPDDLIPDETGGYTVEVSSLPGCISEDDTIDEALADIRDAIALHIEDMIANGEDIPADIPAPILIKVA